MEPQPRIANPDPKCPPAHLIAPSPAGYILIAAAVDPPQRPGPRFGRDRTKDKAKAILLANVKRLASELAKTELDGQQRGGDADPLPAGSMTPISRNAPQPTDNHVLAIVQCKEILW